MLTFVLSPCLPLRRPSPQLAPAHARAPLKRLPVSSCDRWKEFSVGPPSDDAPSPTPAPTPRPSLDWPSWRTSGGSMRVPAIPFPPQEVFLPGESKLLHLFEARYLSLFEHVIVHCDKQCAHVLVAPGRNALAAHGTIVRIREWRRLDVGVSVRFEAVGRLRISKLYNASPFLQADVHVVDDHGLQEGGKAEDVTEVETRFWTLFRQVVGLCVRLGEDPLREKLSTAEESIAVVAGNDADTEGETDLVAMSPEARGEYYEEMLLAAARRAVNGEDVRFFIVTNSAEMLSRRAAALSFAAWEFFESTAGMRQKALEERDAVARLHLVVEQLELRKNKLAAKIALENAFS
ncbi:unnamed protein product [Chondrus crispus]|uniref:Lon N-terminal domain-containing protein n=1 Tax=Chondrus crispus TaxID=2769 RepID=R7Q3Q9_CHOCR|nr:unnamed protein product [Chondrus crispus]CDF32120.1 unnamed protein product [Chondrus crispus]|eukprot:XP_005711785.1 unnamed protein product [Chondrus crispus]